MIRAVVFDLDGVLLDSEGSWDEARKEVVSSHDGHWRDGATSAMQGMSSLEWSRYLQQEMGVDLPAHDIVDLVVEDLFRRYERNLPLIPGAVEVVQRLASHWPLALASSANRVVIERVLSVAGLHESFSATVSSEEVPRGKPAPDVYIEAARRLSQAPVACAAVEDSANGIRSAAAAEMHVVAVPNRQYPPPAEALKLAERVVTTLSGLTVELFEHLDADPRRGQSATPAGA